MDSPELRIPVWKRVFDLIWITLTAPVWLPLMIIMALVVKLMSPGPVFYRQRRVGYGGRHFMILKFRSMKVDARTQPHEWYVERLIQTDLPMTKLDLEGDSRMIPGGRMMRALGLDELPQLFNVLMGEMSLVGPRPCIPSEFECYKPEQKRRVEAPPGLTGLWQVMGKNRLTFSEMIDLDLRYCATMSAKLDALIILSTLPAILGQFLETKLRKTARMNEAEKEQIATEPGTLTSAN